jgi:transketolase
MAKGTASMEGEHETHGAPLPQEELQNTKKLFGIPEGETFFWPEESAKHFQRNFDARTHEASEWQAWLETRMQDPQFKKTFDQYFDPVVNQSLPKINWDLTKEVATRNAFGNIIESWAPSLPSLVGGSADLEPSNMTEGFAKMVGDFSATNRAGRNFAFGVREFPMSAISNGIALHGGLVPFDATFLSFSDYSRAALRLGSLQRTRVIHEFTHDSFYLGEDGPTHQPIEHVMSLRLIPQMYVMRPADALETEVLMTKALELTYPSSLCLTRQKLPIVSGDYQRAKQAAKGAWVIQDNDDINLIIFASGSEVQLALKVAQHLTTDKVRVVSVPCWELFDEQDRNYREQVMAWNCRRRVSIEAGVTLGWQKFVGHDGLMIGIDHFGVSGPAKDLEKEFGFTVGSIVAKISNHSFNH